MKLSQLALTCGVSEQAVRIFCIRRGFQKTNGRWRLTEEQIQEVLDYYLDGDYSLDNEEAENLIREENETCGEYIAEIENLRNQLEEKDKLIEWLQQDLQHTTNRFEEVTVEWKHDKHQMQMQLETLQKQIDSLHNLLDQSQRLQAASAEQVKTLTNQLETALAVAPRKQHWWQRLLSKGSEEGEEARNSFVD